MSGRPVQEGDAVTVASLRKRGVVEKVFADGKVRVAVGSLSIVCSVDQVSPAERARAEPPVKAKLLAQPSARPPTRLDLHGMTVGEATRAVEEYLNRVILSGGAQAKITHGFGTGRVQAAVHELLGRLPVVRAFRLNDRNPGETDVFLA